LELEPSNSTATKTMTKAIVARSITSFNFYSDIQADVI